MPSSDQIGWFADITLADRPTVGGKGGSLGELTRAGIAVPGGFVVRTAAFEQFLAGLEHAAPLRARVEALAADDLDGIGQVSAQLMARVVAAPLPASLVTELQAAHAELCAAQPRAPLAVRSSATTEDAEDASFAGLQDTYLWVMGAAEVERQLRNCWASLYSVPSIAYRRKHGLPEAGVAMAVVVQQMVDARTAGVMFTRSPTTGDRSVIVIEGAWGLGSAVVSGEVTPDRFVVGKITGEISVRDIRDKHIQHVPVAAGGTAEVETPADMREAPCVSDAELMALRAVARRIEKHYGRPQDIEWAIDRQDCVRILQSRPETVWSTKEAAPVAVPKDNPLHHIMSVFGRQTVSLTAKEVADILQALEASGFDTLDLEMQGVKLQLRRSGSGSASAPRAAAPVATAALATTSGRAGALAPATHASAMPVPVDVPPGATAVPAPLLGIFYRAPKPGEPSFVEVGSRVEAGTIIGIIEVMKLMNSVRAGVRGEVVAIPARNGELVEYGEALLFVRAD